MRRNLKAIYEHGVFRPLEALDLPERKQVTLTVADEFPPEAERPEESCFDLAARIGLVGVLRDLPEDLSTNRRHFDGMGK
jgi:predicted DNA-binding antitoxin AbrB/MazE fold protein